MSKVAKDLEALTTIPEKKVSELFNKISYIICETIQEDLKSDKTLSEFDFGIFTLIVNYEDKSKIRYKLIPSKELEEPVKQTINGKLNLLQDKLSTTLVDKFMNVYKDIC